MIYLKRQEKWKYIGADMYLGVKQKKMFQISSIRQHEHHLWLERTRRVAFVSVCKAKAIVWENIGKVLDFCGPKIWRVVFAPPHPPSSITAPAPPAGWLTAGMLSVQPIHGREVGCDLRRRRWHLGSIRPNSAVMRCGVRCCARRWPNRTAQVRLLKRTWCFYLACLKACQLLGLILLWMNGLCFLVEWIRNAGCCWRNCILFA